MVNPQKRSRNNTEVRADKILDAAAELIERWGYNKTTIDDIAKKAGVAKGTIYLHWKTRDDLFWTLLRREDIRLMEDIRRRISEDPEEGSTLHGMLKHSMLATMKSPLARAMLLMDVNMLGTLANKDFSSNSFPERMKGFENFLTYLRDQGSIRADIDIQKHIYMLSAITLGFLLANQWMPNNLIYSDEDIAEMTAETLRRTLEPFYGKQTEQDGKNQASMADVYSSFIQNNVAMLKTDPDFKDDTG